MAQKQGMLARLTNVVRDTPRRELPRILSQKIQRRILHSLLLGPRRTKARVRKRFVRAIDRALHGQMTPGRLVGKRIIEVGCGRGQDFLKHFDELPGIELYGLDLKRRAELDTVENFTFVKADAESIPFDDRFFDVLVSIGVLEHIEPMEKLGRILNECSRVSRSFVHIVPAVSTLWEPHTGVFRWQLRNKERKVSYEAPLNFFSDESWLAFEGLTHAQVFRFDTVPFLCTALAIYRNDHSASD